MRTHLEIMIELICGSDGQDSIHLTNCMLLD
jgi:predicted metal-binding protein